MEQSPGLALLGASMMAGWAVVGYCYPRLRSTCVIFAAAPGFQLLWIGLFPSKEPVTLVPALGVPLATIAAVLLFEYRRAARRSGP